MNVHRPDNKSGSLPYFPDRSGPGGLGEQIVELGNEHRCRLVSALHPMPHV
jgi:hypothetical protein